MAYADYSFYRDNGGTAPEKDVLPMLEAASDAVDALTFDRIAAIGWDRLAERQRDLVMRACCAQADFLLENGDAVRSAMEHYSINGVTMKFGNAALYRIVGGVAVCNDAWKLLARTGLACLMARGREVEPCSGLGW